jgi:hypothetical protein
MSVQSRQEHFFIFSPVENDEKIRKIGFFHCLKKESIISKKISFMMITLKDR